MFFKNPQILALTDRIDSLDQCLARLQLAVRRLEEKEQSAQESQALSSPQFKESHTAKHGRSKITPEMSQQIVKLFAKMVPTEEISRKFNISAAIVNAHVRKKLGPSKVRQIGYQKRAAAIRLRRKQLQSAILQDHVENNIDVKELSKKYGVRPQYIHTLLEKNTNNATDEEKRQ